MSRPHFHKVISPAQDYLQRRIAELERYHKLIMGAYEKLGDTEEDQAKAQVYEEEMRTNRRDLLDTRKTLKGLRK